MNKKSLNEKEEADIQKGLREFSQDTNWISKGEEKLRKKFPNKYIAVMKRKVIDSDSDLQNLIQRLKENGKNPSEIPIEFISKEPTRLIL